MRKTPSRSDKKQPPTTDGRPPRRTSFEWPLLIYPVLFLSALAILYVVSRSIDKESPVRPKSQKTAQGPTATPDRAGPTGRGTGVATDSQTKLASGLSAQSAQPAGGKENPDAASEDSKATSKLDRMAALAGKKPQAVDLSQLKGPAKVIALLRRAVEEKDQAKIKQCIAEIAALGDAAVIPLNDLMMHEEGESALWAATALARIGTPTATSALLDRLSQTKEGDYKEELGKRVSSVRNHDSWPLLVDTMMQSGDTSVVRAAATSLSMMADAPVIDELVARYDSATTVAETERIAQTIRSIRSSKATESLLSLAGSPSSPPQDGLQEAAVEALAKIGDAQSVNHLLRRLESCPPGEETQVYNAITQINSPDAQTSLLYAAAGNKEVSAEHGQTAAIYALKNYPDESTVALLERIIAQGQNEKVVTAATRTLDDIKRSPHAVSAKADSLLKSEQMLPFPAVEK
jgi:hypothetical protein